MHALNEAESPKVSSLSTEGWAQLLEMAHYASVAELDGEFAGFFIGFLPGAPYGSQNYAWFSERYAQFGYCDRLAVAETARGRGIGRALYEDFELWTRARNQPLVACEVNEYPPNPESMAFHERLGYAAVGSQETEGGTKRVRMLIKRLV